MNEKQPRTNERKADWNERTESRLERTNGKQIRMNKRKADWNE